MPGSQEYWGQQNAQGLVSNIQQGNMGDRETQSQTYTSGEIARAKSISPETPTDIKKASPETLKTAQETGMLNGLPVIIKDGRVHYDTQKIGESMGLPQDVIDKASKIRYTEGHGRDVKGTLDSLAGTGDFMQTRAASQFGQQQYSSDMQALGNVNPEAIVLSNLTHLNPEAKLDLNNHIHMMNLSKPGKFSFTTGDHWDGLNDDNKNSLSDIIGKYVVPALGAIVIGAAGIAMAGAAGGGAAAGGSAAGGIGGATTYSASGLGAYGASAAGAAGAAAGGPGGAAGAGTIASSGGLSGGAISAMGTGGTTGAGLSTAGGIDAMVNSGIAAGGMYTPASSAVATPGIFSTLGAGLKSNWPGLALGAGSMIADYFAGEKAAGRAEDYNKDLMKFLTEQQNIEYQRQLERQAEAQKWYEKISLPDPEAVDAARKLGMNTLGQARSNTYGSMTNQLASRGFGSGSGLGVGASESIEGDYLKSLGTLETNMEQFANTRQFAPGGQTYGYAPPNTQQTNQTSVAGGWESALGSMGSILGNAAGMYTANQLLPNMNNLTYNWK